jgi:hypothetical protein
MFSGPHENDPTYDRFERKDVPPDLRQYYRQFKPMYWGFVCPFCKTIFAMSWGGMPSAFRKHISPLEDENGKEICGGCVFHQIKKPKDGKSKREEEARGF